jgi:hypothetical protein
MDGICERWEDDLSAGSTIVASLSERKRFLAKGMGAMKRKSVEKARKTSKGKKATKAEDVAQNSVIVALGSQSLIYYNVWNRSFANGVLKFTHVVSTQHPVASQNQTITTNAPYVHEEPWFPNGR